MLLGFVGACERVVGAWERGAERTRHLRLGDVRGTVGAVPGADKGTK